RVQLAHGLSRLRRELPIVFRRRMTQLPWAVHLVAEAPHLDAERITLTVGDPTLGERCSRTNVAVLEKIERVLNPASAQVHSKHKSAADFVQPRREFMETHFVGLRSEER